MHSKESGSVLTKKKKKIGDKDGEEMEGRRRDKMRWEWRGSVKN
jgi:hypothetical protein